MAASDRFKRVPLALAPMDGDMVCLLGKQRCADAGRMGTASWRAGRRISRTPVEGALELNMGCPTGVVNIRQFCRADIGAQDSGGLLAAPVERGVLVQYCRRPPASYAGARPFFPVTGPSGKFTTQYAHSSPGHFVRRRALRRRSPALTLPDGAALVKKLHSVNANGEIADGRHHPGEFHRTGLRKMVHRAYLQKSMYDEIQMLLGEIYDNDQVGGSGGGPKRNWVNGRTGEDVNGDGDLECHDTLSYEGLLCARDTIAGGGSRQDVVCYTTPKGLTDLANDPCVGYFDNVAREPLQSGSIITVDGIPVVSCTGLAPLAGGGIPHGARSVMFVSGTSFGLAADDAIVVRETRQEGVKIRFMAEHRITYTMWDASSTCRISHA